MDDRRINLNMGKLLNALAFALALVLLPHAAAATPETADPTDRRVADAVTAELMEAGGVRAENVDVRVDEGIVELTGTVNNLLAFDRATDLARRIRGVHSVVNRLQVEPVERTDRQIAEDVRWALRQDAAAESYELRVEVSDATVTLTGEVESWSEKRLAGDVVRAVRGVKAVDNEVSVDYASERSADEIAADVRSTLESDVWVDHRNLTVSVEKDTVRLDGSVPSAAARARAYADAWVAGVRFIDHDGLEVNWLADEEMKRDRRFVDYTDEQLERHVRAALRQDPRLEDYEPRIAVDDGVVTLSGVVGDLEARRAAGSDARNTLGVWRVENLIRVRPEARPNDTRLKTDVLRALKDNPYLDRNEISVVTDNAKVFLYGMVDSRYEKSVADDVVAGVSGVVAVENKLHTRQGWVDRFDWEIKEQIEEELYWNPFVDAEDVTVMVDDGEAELDGTVDTWTERKEAAEAAREGGASEVVNHLRVAYGPDYYIPASPR